MPLPLLPVFIGLGSAIAAGVAAGVSGKSKLNKAKDIDARARDRYKEIQCLLDNARSRTNLSLNNLGRKKLDIFAGGSAAKFLEAAGRLQNIPPNELDGVLEEARPAAVILQDMNDIRLQLQEIAGGLTSDKALPALAALGGVKILAAVGAGKAIASLHGAAAANATVSWLGGSLAAGGLGAAGGMVMIGGITVAPMVLCGGLIFATKGKKILEQAKENQSRVEAFEKDAKAICGNLNNVWKASEQMISVLGRMDDLLGQYVSRLEDAAAVNDNYLTYSAEDRRLVKNCFLINEHMKHLLETKLMDQDGTLISGCLENIKELEQFIGEMNAL